MASPYEFVVLLGLDLLEIHKWIIAFLVGWLLVWKVTESQALSIIFGGITLTFFDFALTTYVSNHQFAIVAEGLGSFVMMFIAVTYLARTKIDKGIERLEAEHGLLQSIDSFQRIRLEDSLDEESLHLGLKHDPLWVTLDDDHGAWASRIKQNLTNQLIDTHDAMAWIKEFGVPQYCRSTVLKRFRELNVYEQHAVLSLGEEFYSMSFAWYCIATDQSADHFAQLQIEAKLARFSNDFLGNRGRRRHRRRGVKQWDYRLAVQAYSEAKKCISTKTYYISSYGQKYVGECKDNRFHGKGAFTGGNDQSITGEWKDGQPWTGIGYDKDGNIFLEWKNGVKIKQQ